MSTLGMILLWIGFIIAGILLFAVKAVVAIVLFPIACLFFIGWVLLYYSKDNKDLGKPK